ncbi:phage terminase small subunit [Streptococcus sp. Marseille-Q5855]|uniref:phage terminase small subunit n=1 Tax=Streptococcus sp. Marseille-Q5855 TaxID=2972781 RepID=UPI0021C92CD3|nr:phage terminase small subunit [Streptococcus sp. Marseille-Q5855]
MGRARDPNRDKAFEIYKQNNGNITNRKIGDMLGVPEKTISVWKLRDKWSECSTTKDECSTTKRKRGAPKGNTNSKGGSIGNQNALKHGLFAKNLPQEVYEIAQELSGKQPIDILWENITLTYANLLHAQRILYVQDIEDTTSLLIASTAKGGESYEVHTAWDKQNKALVSLARAQGELRNMIKTYDEMTRSSLATEEQRLRIEVMKSKLSEDEPENVHDDGFIKALEGIVEETWREEK